MRDPAMHIRLSDFKKVLGNLDLPEKLAYSIFSQAVPFSIKDRYKITGDAKVRAKATKAVAVAKNAGMTVERFNLLLTACRVELGHRHITPIRKGGRDYQMLREIAHMACEFCHNCGFESMDEGCKVFLHLGLGKMKHGNSYGINKFKFYEADIYKSYDSLYMIDNDPKPKRTRKFHDCYVALLAEYAGIVREDLQKPENYVCFVCTRLESDNASANIEDWLRAQFEELQRFADVVPNPTQLFNENALKRYYAYFRSVNKSDEEDKVTLPDWDQPKNDFEKKYAEKLRQKYSEE